MVRRRRRVAATAATGAAVAGATSGVGDGPQARAPAGRRYQMRQRMFTIGDDFYIHDDQGRRAFKVDGKAPRVRSTLKLDDSDDRDLYNVQEKLARVRDSMTIEDPEGRVAARVHNAMRWLRVRDSNGVETGRRQDDAPLLAITVVIDTMAHQGR